MSFSNAELASMAFYSQRYEVVANYELIADRPLRLSDHAKPENRQCRFCGRGAPEVTFKSVAHAVPEFLANRSLVSMNECDGCNQFLAHEYEDHLAKWFGPLRTVFQMRGKGGVPTYKAGDIRIEMENEGLHFTITSPEQFELLSNTTPSKLTLPVQTPSQPYIPIRAAMALIKSACSTCPVDLIPEVTPAIDWLMKRAELKASAFPVLFAFTPGPNPYGDGKVLVLRRRTDEPIPAIWCLIATANVRFQFFVPFCKSDTWLKSGEQAKFNIRHFPTPFGPDWQFGETEYSVLDLGGTEVVVSRPEVTLNVDRVEKYEGP